MPAFRPFDWNGNRNACHWCGRALLRRRVTRWAESGKPPERCKAIVDGFFCFGTNFRFVAAEKAFVCLSCGGHTPTRRRVLEREDVVGLGRRGDPFFCDLFCAKQFAVEAVESGFTFRPRPQAKTG
jgi:hypothetical protein